MLVLTRKANETIKIGNDIVLKVICTGTKTVRIGIEAPGDVRILRGELPEYPQTEDMKSPAMEPPFVADAVADTEPAELPVVPGPMTADKFLAEFSDDHLPGRSIRRMLKAQRAARNSAAK
jgi:carbon storage regulator